MIFGGKEENPVVCLDVFIVLFLYLYLSKCLCICIDNLYFRIEETRWKPVVVLVAALVCLDVLLHLLLLLFLGDATIRQIYCLISRQFTLFGLFLFNCPPFVCTLLRWRESVWTLNAGVSHIAPTTTTLELCSIKWCETSNVWWIWVVLEKDDLNPPQKWPEPKHDLNLNQKMTWQATLVTLPSPQPGLYSIPGSNCIRTKTCRQQNMSKVENINPLGRSGGGWSHLEGLWSHISFLERLVLRCCHGTWARIGHFSFYAMHVQTV